MTHSDEVDLIHDFNMLNGTRLDWNSSLADIESELFDRIEELGVKKVLQLINLAWCIIQRSPYMDFGIINKEEEKFLSFRLSCYRKYHIMELYSSIVEQFFNEFIKRDLDVLDSNGKVWLTINLSFLYSSRIDAWYTLLDGVDFSKILVRTVPLELKSALIKNIMIISSLKRDPEIIFFLRSRKSFEKNDFPQALMKDSSFTRGYRVCISPLYMEKLRGLRYTKKLYKTRPTVIVQKASSGTVGDFLKNSSYSSDIFIRPYVDVENVWRDKKLMEFLALRYQNSFIVETLNKLNAVPLTIDLGLLKTLENLANTPGNDRWKLRSKNSLRNDIYIVGRESDDTIIADESVGLEIMDLDRSVQDAATFELIIKQINDVIKFNKAIFYLDYRMDPRIRVYPNSWPLNYQLNHIVRCVTLIAKKLDLELILAKFNAKYPGLTYEEKFPFYSKLNDVNKNFMSDLVGSFWFGELKTYICESLTQAVVSVSSCCCNDENLRLKEGLEKVEIFGSDKSLEYRSKQAAEMGLDDKTLLKIINNVKILEGVKGSRWDEVLNSTVWLDASSNSLQLVAYRLGVDNLEVLKLLNIYDNDTKYSGIYEFVAERIVSQSSSINIEDMRKSVEEMGISLEDFNNKNDAKRRLMPSAYGKTLYACLKEDAKLFPKRLDEWTALSFEDRAKVSTYLWFKSLDILKEVGLNIEEYRKLFDKKTQRYWMNDLGVPVVINNNFKTRKQFLDDLHFKKTKQVEDIIKTTDKTQRQRVEEVQNALVDKRNSRIILRKTTKKEGLNEIDMMKVEAFSYIEETIEETTDKKLVDIFKLFRLIMKLEEEIYEDEKKFQRRRGVVIRDMKITIRIPSLVKVLDRKGVKRSLLPSSVHTYDACVFFGTVEGCSDLGISVLGVHDALGCQLGVAPFVRIVFIKTNIGLIKKSQEKAPYPLEKVYKNKLDFRKMLKSRNIFRM